MTTENLKKAIRRLEKQLFGKSHVSLLDSGLFDNDEDDDDMRRYYNQLWKDSRPNWNGFCPIGADEV